MSKIIQKKVVPSQDNNLFQFNYIVRTRGRDMIRTKDKGKGGLRVVLTNIGDF